MAGNAPSYIVRPAAEANIEEAALWYELRSAGLGADFLLDLALLSAQPLALGLEFAAALVEEEDVVHIDGEALFQAPVAVLGGVLAEVAERDPILRAARTGHGRHDRAEIEGQ